MKRKQGRPRTRRDPWDFEGPFSVEPFNMRGDREAEG